MRFFKFTGKNRALIMAENKEEAINIFESEITDFDDDEEIERIGETSANAVVWRADIDFDDYNMMREIIREKEKSQIIHVGDGIE